jgi:hypothetical protein
MRMPQCPSLSVNNHHQLSASIIQEDPAAQTLTETRLIGDDVPRLQRDITAEAVRSLVDVQE